MKQEQVHFRAVTLSHNDKQCSDLKADRERSSFSVHLEVGWFISVTDFILKNMNNASIHFQVGKIYKYKDTSQLT